MERLLLLLLVLLSWTLADAGIEGSGLGVRVEGWESNGAPIHLRNFRNVRARRLLQIGGGNQSGRIVSPPAQAPSHKKHKRHRGAPTPAPQPALSPSPFVSPSQPPEGSPSPLAFAPTVSFPPSAASLGPFPMPPPRSPMASSPQAVHHPRVDTPVSSLHKHIWVKYVSVIAGVAVFLAMSTSLALYCRAAKVGTVRPWATGLSGQLQKAFVTGVPALKRSELETACEDFSNIIGSMSSCILYKGTLSSGVEIAVASSMITSAKDWSKECESQYRKKITSLSRVSHKNFMNLLGYCEEERPFTRVMVFEYAPNGTLFEHLHIRETENLDWMMRLRVSMGIAYCLEHMHQLNPPVVPRSFDSSTVYLTDDFAAKISDIDFWNDTKDADSAAEPSALPDLESIVHKYGIVLLEILSGRLPFSEEDGLLEQWASNYFDGAMSLAELIDPSIGSYSEETARALCDVIRTCIDPDPKKRPTMREVVNRMREITALGPDGATPKVSPLWWAELEIISSEAS